MKGGPGRPSFGALAPTSLPAPQPASQPELPLAPPTTQTADPVVLAPPPLPPAPAAPSEEALAPPHQQAAGLESSGRTGVHPSLPTPPPRNRRTGLTALVTVILLAVVGGGIAAGVILTGGAHPSQHTPGSSSSLPSGFQSFTNADTTFRITYPSDWQQSAAAHGTGATFTGPDGQTFIVSNVGGPQNYPTSFTPTRFDGVCTSHEGFDGFGGTAGPAQTVSLGGQEWTQEACDSGDGTVHVVVETILYQNTFFTMAYYSTPRPLRATGACTSR